MNRITLTDHSLTVEPAGLDKLWSFRSALDIPLAEVRGATHDPGMIDEPKGPRAPGLHTGSEVAGTYRRDGKKDFWNVSGRADIVVIQLDGSGEYDRLVLSVDDPAQVVDRINDAARQ